MNTGFFPILLFFAGTIVVIAIGSSIFFFYDEIKQSIHEFLENRIARKIAKKIGLIDKGKISPTIKFEKLANGKFGYVTYQQIHFFCENPLRIGLSQEGPVKWCVACEVIVSKNGGGGGPGKDSPTPKPTPDDMKEAYDAIERMKKGPNIPSNHPAK